MLKLQRTLGYNTKYNVSLVDVRIVHVSTWSIFRKKRRKNPQKTLSEESEEKEKLNLRPHKALSTEYRPHLNRTCFINVLVRTQ